LSRPAQIEFLSRTARLYDPVARALRFPRLWETLAERAGPAFGEACLDLCTGTGGVAVALARRGARAVGLDLAPGMLDRARRKAHAAGVAGRARFLRGDAAALAFPDRSFPVVTCSMALHEMAEEERSRVLREMRRVSRDRVLVADYRVPAAPLGAAVFRLTRAFEYLESDDFEGFARRDLRARLLAADLAVESRLDCGPYRIWCCRPGPGGPG
jgi:ubiquinone/menaquinone biosynthesis C-methylase UbiE